MSTEPQEESMGTKPVAEHAWLQKLVGEWKTETEFVMGPGGPTMKGEGTDSTKSLDGLWAFSEIKGAMPGGAPLTMVATLGYDVSFKEYRGCWFANMSSHLWKSTGTLSEDGKKMTLEYVGPDMVEEGKTANYRDVIEIVDADHRTLTSYGPDEKGEWQQYMKATYTRQ